MRLTYVGLAAAILAGISTWGDAGGRAPAPQVAGAGAHRPAFAPFGGGAAAWAGQAPRAAGKMQAALADARKQNKHLFALFVRAGDGDCSRMKGVLRAAEPSLRSRALFRVVDVSDASEASFIAKYQIDRAPLPLTLVFAPNGAIVKAFAGKVASKADLSSAFSSPAYAAVMRGVQDGKMVLLCVQGKGTKHNAESLAAVKAAARDKRARGAVVVKAAPEAAANARLLKPLQVGSSLKDATVFVLAPPATLAGKLVGATTRQAVLDALAKAVSACGGGDCGPVG